jgi:hypothetical protein
MNQSLASQACCSLNEDTTDILYQLCLLSANQHHDLVIPLLLEMDTFCILLGPKYWAGYMYTYLHPPSGADKVSKELWQLITAIRDKGDGLTLSE